MWEIIQLVLRLLFNLTIIQLLGGLFFSWVIAAPFATITVSTLKKCYVPIALILVLVFLFLQYVVKVIVFAGMGWQGVWDWDNHTFLLSIGESRLLLITLIAASLLSFFYCLDYWIKEKNRYYRLLQLAQVLCLLLLLNPYFLTGHYVDSPWFYQLLMPLHLLLVCIWIGSLLPLAQCCNRQDVVLIQQIMLRFGRIASVFVPLLLATGLALFFHHFSWPLDSMNQSYYWLFLIKLILILCILLLALTHKFFLVKRLQSRQSVRRLQFSIYIEYAVAVLIVAVSATVNSYVGLHY